MSFFDDLLKPRAGGTDVGNGLRGAVNRLTNGAFGNGAMVRGDGESISDYWQRIKDGLLTGIGSGANSSQFHMQTPITFGVVTDKIKNAGPKIIKWLLIGGGVLLLFGLGKKMFGKKRTNP